MSNEPADRQGEFVLTKEYRRFEEFCDACRRDRYIGLCYGPPGVGKTISARHYAQWGLIEETHADFARTRGLPAALDACRTVFYTPSVANTPKVVEHDVGYVRMKLNRLVEELYRVQAGLEEPVIVWNAPDRTELIIVDEADRLKMSGLEQVRDIYDRGNVGLILIGMPGIEKRMARYPQLYSRVGFAHQFRPLSTDELRAIIEQKWQQLGLQWNPSSSMDAEASAAIIRITGGNSRLLQRLFAQIERIMQINELQTVSKEVVETAREILVIGSA